MGQITTAWSTYEAPLREQFATMDLEPAKLNFVLLAARDALLRCAPLVELRECPPAIEEYIGGLTLRLLAQVARQAGVNYDISAVAAKAYGAVLIEESGPLEALPLNPKEAP